MDEAESLPGTTRDPSSERYKVRVWPTLPEPNCLKFPDGGTEGKLNCRQSTLASPPPYLELPLDYQRSARRSHHIDEIKFDLDSALSSRIATLANACGASNRAVVCAAWALLLSRISGQTDFFIGMPNLSHAASEPIESTDRPTSPLVLRINANADVTLRQFISHVEEEIQRAKHHCDLPSMHPAELEDDIDRGRPCQSALVVHVVPNDPPPSPSLVNVTEAGETAFRGLDVTLSLSIERRRVAGRLAYATDLFLPDTIKRWVDYLAKLLEEITSRPVECRTAHLSMLSSSERHRILTEFNQTRAPFPQNTPVNELFEIKVAECPDATAIVEEGHSITYLELNRLSNRLSEFLKQQGVKPDEPVPILMSRGIELIAVQLAILKCGGIYVPLDLALPQERRDFIIRDSGARQIICQESPQSGARRRDLQWIDCHSMIAASQGYSDENRGAAIRTSASPAYVMYTSGSTGKPKGVVISHRGIVRLSINGGYIRYVPTDRLAHCSNPAFDASTFEVWCALLNGLSIVIVRQSELLEPALLAAAIRRHGVTTMILTTALFNQHVSHSPSTLFSLRNLLFGGEAADPRIVKKMREFGFEGNLLNVYGPTETTTFATAFDIGMLDCDQSAIPIGRPISNTEAYVLDSSLRPVAIGVVGEIYIGGPGLALGYSNRPDLTAERFIAHPFCMAPGERLYRSGDLGRWLTGGILEYRGRNDQQVKIRGFRIELGDIESQVAEYSQAKEVAVLAREDIPGEKKLVAYLVLASTPDRRDSIDRGALNSKLGNHLPEYMLPTSYVVMNQFPLTDNGKLNRKQLPIPGPDDHVGRQYEKPQGKVEEQLAGIWKKLLGISRVGRYDNFFQLGGNSLRGMKLAAKVSEEMNVKLSTFSVFKAPVLCDLAELVDTSASQLSATSDEVNGGDFEEGVL